MTGKPVSLILSRWTTLGLLVLGLLVRCPGAPVEAQAHTDHAGVPLRHVMVDTDMGLDDVRAIFALLADSTLDLEAFLTVDGSASPGKGADNLIGLLEASGSGSIPVIRGSENAMLEPPPWRQTANGLGGAPFPPPRKTTAEPFDPSNLAALMRQAGGIEYLALGPLTNLHMLETGSEGSLDLIDALWIPAVVKDGRMSGWNLLCDPAASEAVLVAAPRVVIIDISGAEGIDGRDFLSSLEGSSYPVSWITEMLEGLGQLRRHIMLYDEIAAAAFVRPELVDLDARTFELERGEEESFELTPDSNGNVRVARLANPRHLLAELSDLWVRGPVDRHTLAHASEIPVEDLLRTFHGHLGPYVVIGYRMGKLALLKLDSEGHFGLSAEVYSPLKPPRSCLIDGIQLGSGCTLGKGNITVEEAPEPARAVFTLSDGRKVTIVLRPEVPPLVADLVNGTGVEAAGRAFLEMRLDSLFAVDRGPMR